MDENDEKSLENQRNDYLASVARGLSSFIPLIGGPLSEVITSVIPNQRIDRVTRYLVEVENRMDLAEDKIRSIMENPEKVALLEEGAVNAAKAVAQKRIDYIASIVATGLQHKSSIYNEIRMLKLLSEIDDDQILILIGFSLLREDLPPETAAVMRDPDPERTSKARHRLQKHNARALYDFSVNEMSYEDEFDKLAVDGLLALKLLRENSRLRDRDKTENPQSGMQPRRIGITNLGHMLINYIGAITKDYVED